MISKIWVGHSCGVMTGGNILVNRKVCGETKHLDKVGGCRTHHRFDRRGGLGEGTLVNGLTRWVFCHRWFEHRLVYVLCTYTIPGVNFLRVN
jgi:hypothetical protein